MGEPQGARRFTFVASFYYTAQGEDYDRAFDEAVEWFRNNLEALRVDEDDVDFAGEQEVIR